MAVSTNGYGHGTPLTNALSGLFTGLFVVLQAALAALLPSLRQSSFGRSSTSREAIVWSISAIGLSLLALPVEGFLVFTGTTELIVAAFVGAGLLTVRLIYAPFQTGYCQIPDPAPVKTKTCGPQLDEALVHFPRLISSPKLLAFSAVSLQRTRTFHSNYQFRCNRS